MDSGRSLRRSPAVASEKPQLGPDRGRHEISPQDRPPRRGLSDGAGRAQPGRGSPRPRHRGETAPSPRRAARASASPAHRRLSWGQPVLRSGNVVPEVLRTADGHLRDDSRAPGTHQRSRVDPPRERRALLDRPPVRLPPDDLEASPRPQGPAPSGRPQMVVPTPPAASGWWLPRQRPARHELAWPGAAPGASERGVHRRRNTTECPERPSRRSEPPILDQRLGQRPAPSRRPGQSCRGVA